MRQTLACSFLALYAGANSLAGDMAAPENRIVWRAPGEISEADWVWGRAEPIARRRHRSSS